MQTKDDNLAASYLGRPLENLPSVKGNLRQDGRLKNQRKLDKQYVIVWIIVKAKKYVRFKDNKTYRILNEVSKIHRQRYDLSDASS